jgi:enamine deaminase RidA (YjgF/YER057c/UK114 family)
MNELSVRANPASLPPSTGVSQLAQACGPWMYIAGQVAVAANGLLVDEGDFIAQLEQVFRNLDIAVREAGARFADVVKLNYYCVESVDRSLLPHVARVRDRYVDTSRPPASTFVFVPGLVRKPWLIEIEAVVALDSQQWAHIPIDSLAVRANPASLPQPNGVSHLAEARGHLMFISGQVAETADGALVGKGDFVAQLEQVFRNLDIAVREAGAQFSDVVKLNLYCVNTVERALLTHVPRVRAQYADTARPPASTFVFVSGLARKAWLIEIEAVVALPQIAVGA